MIYIFDKKQKINKVFTNEDLTAGHLDFKLNTATTFEFSVPANKALPSGSKYVAVPHPLDDSKFVFLRLTERVDKTDTIDYSAYELAYQELRSYGYISDKRPKDADALTLMKTALNGTNWELNKVNVAGKASTSFYYVDHLTAISSVVDLLGGEIVFYVEIQGNTISGRYMDYLARQGEDTSKVFSKGSNLLTVERQTDMSSVYTAILPRGKGVQVSGQDDEETPDGYGRRLNIADVEWKKSNGKPLDKAKGSLILGDPDANKEWGHIDGQYRLLLQNYDDVDNVNVLINSAYKTLKSVNHPQIQYSATVADVGGLSLGDTVLIMHGERNLSYKTRVFEVNYDLLAPDQTEISLGDDLTENSIASQVITLGSSQNTLSEQTQWTVAQVGREPLYFGSDYPEHPKVGDILFKYLPNGDTVVYRWNGTIWEKLVSSNTAAEISDAVDDAIQKAKEYTDELNEKQAEEVQKFQSEANSALSEAAAERNSLSIQADTMLSGANSYADSMAGSAAAYGKAQASNVLSQAQSELATAKQELGSEVSKAQADITATNKELAGKVSQTDFDKTTGDLSTKYGQIKATADAVTTDVAKYKDTNDKKVSANTANIATMSDQIESKVSQTDFDKTTGDLSGKYTETKQTVDSISNTVTELQAKVNAQGQINQLMNTEFSPDLQGWDISNPGNIATVFTSNGYQGSVGLRVNAYSYNNDDDQTYYKVEQTLDIPDFISFLSLKVRGYIYEISDNDYAYVNANIQALDSSGNTISAIVPGTELFDKVKVKTWQESGSQFVGAAVPEGTKKILISIYVRGRASINISQPMVVFDSTIGDYVPGNYNNNNRVAALELGVDHITGLVNDPKNGLSATATLAANGMTVATQAQNDATTAINTAKGTQTTVSSVQKDVKDLQSTTSQTAGQVTTEIQDRKNGDDNIFQQSKNYTISQIQSVTTGYQSAIEQSAAGVLASVSMPNKLVNTEFEPDLEGWTINNPLSGTGKPATIYTSNGYGSSNGLRINAYSYNADDADAYYQVQQSVKVPDNVSVASFRVMGYIYAISDNDNAYINANVAAIDSAGKKIGSVVGGTTLFNKATMSSWQESGSRFINMSIPDGTDRLQISIYARGQTSVNISQPMLVFNSTVGNYQVGSYNNMGTSTVLELLKDNWALGIADNAGRLISGINGDTSGTVIQGKKLVINSDTTINGKAFINGAVIKDGSISNAQIGKAAVGSAQIINVDVSKISGNIANFITGNINTLNSKVLYGDTGHLTTVDTGLIINNQDDHLQLSSKGQYDVPTKRAQFELLGYANNVDKNMQGSLNYYKNPHNKGTGLGIRFLGNQILAIDEAVATGNLYLSPYASGQVQVVNRDRNGFQDIKASKFVTSSERKYKSEIEDFNDNALELVNNLNVRKYIKNNEDEIGVIADEADERILDKTNTGVDLYSFVSVVAKAVQELSAQVKELQNERPNN